MKTKVELVLHDLHKQGWSVAENFFSLNLIKKLNETLISLGEKGHLNQAGIGRENNFHIEKSIRNDEISWFDDGNLNEAQKQYLSLVKQLQDAFNQFFYLGLFEFEVHFALYSENAFYKRHLDQHKNQDTRVITFITYLNESWLDENGGQLQLYFDDGKFVSILPKAGTVVCFMSAEFEHEVMPANRERASLTGWFRKQK